VRGFSILVEWMYPEPKVFHSASNNCARAIKQISVLCLVDHWHQRVRNRSSSLPINQSGLDDDDRPTTPPANDILCLYSSHSHPCQDLGARRRLVQPLQDERWEARCASKLADAGAISLPKSSQQRLKIRTSTIRCTMLFPAKKIVVLVYSKKDVMHGSFCGLAGAVER